MKAILLIDHGSVRSEANEMLACVANMVQKTIGDEAIIRFAHMELAEPGIPEGFAACVNSGATEIVVFPYMLSPGKHSVSDIPRMVAEAASHFPAVAFRVTPPFGVARELGDVILQRAGLRSAQDNPLRCWHPSAPQGTCGESCCPATQHASMPMSQSSPATPASHDR